MSKFSTIFKSKCFIFLTIILTEFEYQTDSDNEQFCKFNDNFDLEYFKIILSHNNSHVIISDFILFYELCFRSRGRSLVPTFVFPGKRPTYAKDFEKNVIILVKHYSRTTVHEKYSQSCMTT